MWIRIIALIIKVMQQDENADVVDNLPIDVEPEDKDAIKTILGFIGDLLNGPDKAKENPVA